MIRFIMAALLTACLAGAGAELTGKVLAVSDGDTVTVLDDLDGAKFRIRLAGIDAPEKAQSCGTESKAYLIGMVSGKTVRIRFRDVDRYGRIVGRVYVGKMDVNFQMLRAGYAWHYADYDLSEDLAGAEAAARREKKGLWRDHAPVAPWDFRRKKEVQK